MTRRIRGPYLVASTALVAWSALFAPAALARGAPEERASVPQAPTAPPPSRDWFVGAVFTTNSAGLGQLIARPEVPGALVVAVIPESPARVAGLTPGNVVVAMDGQPIRNDRRASVLLRAATQPVHDLVVVGADGADRSVRLDAAPRPPADLRALLNTQVDQSPAGRLLFAQLAPDAQTALAVLGQIEAEFPSVAEVHALRAQRLLDLGADRGELSDDRRSAVRASIGKALELDPASLTVRLTAAGVLIALGDAGAAVGHAAQAVAIDAASHAAHHLVGAARLAEGDARGALADLARAVELDPYDPQPYQALIEAFRAAGRDRDARATEGALDALISGGFESDTASPPLGAVAVATLAAASVGAIVVFLAGRRRAGPGGLTPTPEFGPGDVLPFEALGALALLSLVVPWLGRALDLSAGAPMATEVADHVVPGAVLLGACVFAVRDALRSLPARLRARRRQIAAMCAAAAGFWMTATHVPLFLDLLRGAARVEVVALHGATGPLVMLLSALVLRPSALVRLAPPGRRGGH